MHKGLWDRRAPLDRQSVANDQELIITLSCDQTNDQVFRGGLVRITRRLLTMIGIILIAVAILIVTYSVSKCFPEPVQLTPGAQCPEAYYGLSVTTLLTIGLTSLAISLSSAPWAKRITDILLRIRN
jgi:hypothetical protein